MAAFAGTAAVMIGTSPLTNIGSPDKPYFLLSILSGLVGLAAVFIAIYLTLNILVRKTIFIGDIVQDPELVAAIRKNRIDLLPPHYGTPDEFFADRAKVLDDMTSSDTATKAAAAANYTAVLKVTTRLRAFASFERLRLDFDRNRKRLFALAVVAALSFGCFAWASNAKQDMGSATRVYCGDKATPSVPTLK
jgi:hypothetical protein